MDTDTRTNWIWLSPWGEAENAQPHIICFRRVFTIHELPAFRRIRITADSRYKLYLNGLFLQEGPCKGNAEIWFFDQAELSAWLVPGENVLAVEVLRYPADMARRNHSLYRSETPCLYVEEIPQDGSNDSDSLDARSGWKCRLQDGISFTGEPFRPAPLHILENVAQADWMKGWMLPGYREDKGWTDAVPYPVSYRNTRIAESPFYLKERPIPYMKHTEKTFQKPVCVREAGNSPSFPRLPDPAEEAEWTGLLSGQSSLTVPPRFRLTVELDAGALTTGYLHLSFLEGAESRVTIHTAECYAYEAFPNGPGKPSVWRKGDRTDWKNGRLHGMSDHYRVTGWGTDRLPETWESYWFRTFRYVGLTIETAEQPLRLSAAGYRETGYPLEVKTRVETSDESLNAVWEISERTLRRCMQETYFDCPFYEQLQYAMDARSEILYTYAVSADDRLARRTMEDFRLSQRSDGLLNSCAPSVRTNVIPGFSIYYILMLHDHMMYFGDRELIRRHLPAVDGILGFFDANRAENGLVAKVGGPHFKAPYWSFIDWTPQWDKTGGVPTACLQKTGSITMESLLYLMGLDAAKELCRYAGRPDTAREYEGRAGALREALLSSCMGEYALPDGSHIRLLQDGPGVEEYSVHCQAFAILCGLVSAGEGRKMLRTVLDDPERFAQCSVAMQFYLFRALEKAEWYEKTDDLWNLWRRMVSDHMTTCVENDTDARSDCHAWASLILYELPCVCLGVRPAAPGFAEISVRPQPGYLSSCRGDVVTPRGMVHVEWKKEESGELQITHRLPD